MPEEKDKPSKESLEMQRKADEMDRIIVSFKNIDNETFTHAFKGITNSIAPGASVAMRLTEADHLATHLARKIISRDKKKLPDEKVPLLWSDEEVAELKKKIISQIGTDEKASLTPEQAHQQDQDQLNERFSKKLAPEPVPAKKAETTVTKKDVILELEKRGVQVDQEKSKEELLSQLMELEAQG